MLQIGDKVVYPMHGAGEISAIQTLEILGEERSYYVLSLSVGNLKVMIPIDNVSNIGLRCIIDEKEVQSIVDVLEGAPETFCGTWNKRVQENISRMKSGNVCDVAAVYRNLSLQTKSRKISSDERRLLELSKQILISELVYVCHKTSSEMETWLQEMLSKNEYQ